MASDLLNFAELVKNELMKSLSKKIYLANLSPLNVRTLRAYNKELDNFTKILINMSVVINQFAFTGINFRGMLHHDCNVAYEENMCGRMRTRICRSTN